MHPRLAGGGQQPHFEQLDEGFAAREQAITLEQCLFFERLEMLGDGVDQIGVRNTFWE